MSRKESCSPSGFTFREVQPADLEALYRLDQICFEPGIAYSRRELRRYLGLPTAQAVVAETAGEIAGFSLGCLADPNTAHVVTLDIAPGHRRRGLGSVLLEELLRRLERAGVQEARLEVDRMNGGALAFYEKHGFERTCRLPDYYGPDRDAYQMRRPFKGLRPRRKDSEAGPLVSPLG